LDAVAGDTRALRIEDVRADVAVALEEPPDAIRDDDDLLRLGLDSISVMRLASRWRLAGAQVTFAELIEWRTLGEWWGLLSARMPDGDGAGPGSTPIPEVDESAPFALAPMQHAYWVGRADGQPLGGVGAHFYNEFDGGGVEPERLERAVRQVLHRHGMLRAVIGDDGTQRIRPESSWSGLTVHDLRASTVEAAEERLSQVRERMSHRRLRVRDGEVFDVALSLLPGGASRVHLHIEMLVADAHSFRVLLSDLARAYTEPDQPLPPIGLSYPRYLAAVAGGREAERARARRYWQRRLDDLPGPPELPLAADPARLTGHRVTRHHHWLDRDRSALLARRARTYGLTPSTVFLTAFTEVLGAWSATPRFLLNLPFYDRQPIHPEVTDLVGDFTSLLLLAVDVTEPGTFAERARRVQEQLRADAAHGAYSGVEVLRDLARHRGTPVAAPVVYTSALNLGELFDEQARECFGAPGWTMSQTPQVWLDYQVTEREDGLFLNWDAVAELFTPGVVEDMFGAYLRLVEWLLADEADWDRPAPDPLSAGARDVRRAANATDRPARDRGLHDDFFALARRDPDRPALLWGENGRCGYGELADRAGRLAAALVAAGLAPGATVAVTLPKGPDQVVAALGVLYAGGTYVPVGVDQPPGRRNRIYTAAGVRLVVAEPGIAMLPAQVRPVPLPETGPLIAEPVPPVPDAPAYLLFTSGSTGEPKGVEVPHRAALNTIDDLRERFAIGADDRVLAVSALDFDLSVFDIFGPLSAGGAVVLIDDAARRDAARWVELVRRWTVTIWQSVPALLEMLLTAADHDRAELPVRLALLGGDWVGLDLAARLAARAPGGRLIALGGTTETAIHSTVQPVPPEVPAHWRSVPYGRPLHNQRMRVVDPQGRDRPDWVPGELWIGGRSVALGYRGDPDRTARQFVTHQGERWYRTGDLARYWPDGTVEFLGRADFQVKIRGHRIEPGEVEVAIEADPAVDRAIVVAAGEGTRRHLVAAVLAAVGTDPDPDRLRGALADRLPPYLVPARVVVVDTLPLSANGKVDRGRLAEMLDVAAAADTIEPPVGEVEQAVAAIWSKLLGVDGIGRNHSFFALGGDSLVATRLLGELRSAGLLGADLPTLFRAPVLADLAAALRPGGAPQPEPAPFAVDPASRHEPFPATDVQRAYWFGRTDDFALGSVGSHWYWEFDGVDVDLGALEDAVNTLIARHDMLRAVFDADGRQRVLRTVPRFSIQVDEGDEALAGLRETLSHRVPDPANWPLMDIRAVRYCGRRTRVGFSFDYIVLDALSIVIFFSELAALYHDPQTALPPVRVTFRDYVLGAQPPADELAAAERYWRARIDDLPEAPKLPLAKDPETVSAPRFNRRQSRLSPERWRGLTDRARANNLTPAAVLAAAYAEVLSAWSGQDALTLNLTMFNRRQVHPDIDRVLGDFTSLLLVAHRAGPGDGWLDLVRRFQHEVWDGMTHGAASAIWVLREMARRAQAPAVSMPVVFTSALGVASELVDMSFPFGELVWGISQTPQVWLDNQVMERDGGLAFNWDSVDELFPEGVVDAMFAAYQRLLDWLCTSDWSGPVPDLLPVAQREVRAAVNATAGPAPEVALHEAFFARAAGEPARPAVLWSDDGTLSYGELAAQALRIGGALAAEGLARGEPVAVTLPRGPDQIAAVLGVLAAGGSYVPIGTDQPAARRDRIRARAGVRFTVGPDGIAPDVAGPALPGPVPVSPDSLAYTIFTSGSTGEPKGVEIAHRAAANTVDDINQRFGVGPDDRVLAVSALDFDLSVYDIFGLLSAGGAVVCLDDADRREARTWVRLARRWRVSVWNSVPALLDMLLVAAGDEQLADLRVALASGDWVGLDLPARLAAAAPGARFVALGGATEAAIWSNAIEVSDVPAHWRSVPYGRPLRNQRYRVVDGRGRDCPDWVAGELRIGGLGVALGYRGDPATTAAQFVHDGGERWYRTGDLGRYWPDGTLEFLGRRDFQLKIRGHRIELGEIEAAADGYPGVARAVAFTTGTGAARHLALAVVPGDGPDHATFDAAPVIAFLAERLPAYMVPEQVLVAETLPLTGNGKVDRRRLGELVAAGADRGEDEPPAGDTEKLVAELWAELLERDRIGRLQSFFALGGDSLLATRLVEAVRLRYGVALSLRQIFAVPTVAQLAALVDAERGATVGGDFEEGVL
jgi:yersiniabactin nonribosomal peptide synthetase